MIRIVLPIVFILCMASTCERSLDLELEEIPPRLVVIAYFTNDASTQVTVKQTRPIDEAQQDVYIKNATVQIFEGDEFLEQLELVDGPTVLYPYYANSNFVPEVNVLYNIKVEAPGFEPVMAQNSIPNSIPISTLQVSDIQTGPGENPGDLIYRYRVRLSFNDPADEVNFYHLTFSQQVLEYIVTEGDTTITGTNEELIRFNDINNNNTLTASLFGGVLLEDTSFNGDLVTNWFDLQQVIDTDREILGKMFVSLRSVTEEYYQYERSVNNQKNDPTAPFGSPSVLFNNIENGAGVFAGYNQSMDSVIIQ